LGFLFLRLHSPIKTTPRQFIEAGSIGIGGSQTGIYTVNSPGGWNIIGKSPLRFFASEKNPAALLKAGDYVRFKAISSEAYREIEESVLSETYILEQEVFHD
jgi:inhibitor of KinA